MSDLTDQELVRELVAPCPARRNQAWAEWMRRFRPPALRLAATVLCSCRVPASSAEDAVQEADLALLAAVGRLDATRSPLPYYLQTVRRKALDIVRREIRHRQVLGNLQQTAAVPPANPFDVLELDDEVQAILAFVSPEERELMTARYLKGDQPREIAAERGVAVQVVYRLLHNGRCRARVAAATAVQASAG